MYPYSPTVLELILNKLDEEAQSGYDYDKAKSTFKLNGNLSDQIKAVEQALLDAKGPLIRQPMEEGQPSKKIRIFDGDKKFEIHTQDLYARSLQHAHAMLKIAEIEKSKIDEGFVRGCLVKYTEEMEKISGHKAKDFKKAKEQSINFIGISCAQLADKRLELHQLKPESEKAQEKLKDVFYLQAFKDIKKAIELYDMLEPSEDIICTVVGKDTQNIEFKISEKINFPLSQDNENRQVIISKNSVWYRQNQENYGDWFDGLMSQNNNENLKAILSRSPPCTTRDMPNPSNAWDEKTLFVKKDDDHKINILHQEDKVRSAISSPFNIKDKEERVRIAVDSMKKLFSKERITELANQYNERWGTLLGPNEKTIPLYLLHQTLVAPTFFYGADRDMMVVKQAANKEFSEYLKSLDITVKGNDNVIREVKCTLGQVNNCVNMWHPVIIPTDNDLNDSNKLISEVGSLLGKLNENFTFFLDENTLKDIELVKEYLDDQKRTWIPLGRFDHKDPTTEQKHALDRLSQKLKDGGFEETILKKESQMDLALMCQAATHLKQLNHESQLGFAMRKIKNAIRIKEVPVLAPLVGAVLSPVYATQYLVNTAKRLYTHVKDNAPPRLKDAFFPTRNKQTAIAAYQNILGGKLGITVGGCKSAFDREGEVKNHSEAMVQSFMQTGKIFDATQGDKAYYEYLNGFVKQAEESGHQNRIVAHVDRIGARKMWESRTHYYETSSKETKDIVRGVAAKFRKLGKPPIGKDKEHMLNVYENTDIIVPNVVSHEIPSRNYDNKRLSDVRAKPSATSLTYKHSAPLINKEAGKNMDKNQVPSVDQPTERTLLINKPSK